MTTNSISKTIISSFLIFTLWENTSKLPDTSVLRSALRWDLQLHAAVDAEIKSFYNSQDIGHEMISLQYLRLKISTEVAVIGPI